MYSRVNSVLHSRQVNVSMSQRFSVIVDSSSPQQGQGRQMPLAGAVQVGVFGSVIVVISSNVGDLGVWLADLVRGPQRCESQAMLATAATLNAVRAIASAKVGGQLVRQHLAVFTHAEKAIARVEQLQGVHLSVDLDTSVLTPGVAAADQLHRTVYRLASSGRVSFRCGFHFNLPFASCCLYTYTTMCATVCQHKNNKI